MADEKQEDITGMHNAIANALPGLIWMTDAQGRQVFASRRWKEYTGVDPYDESGFEQIVHSEDQERVMRLWKDCLLTGSNYNVELRLKSRNGDYQWFSATGEGRKKCSREY